MKPAIIGFRLALSLLWLYWIWRESHMWGKYLEGLKAGATKVIPLKRQA